MSKQYTIREFFRSMPGPLLARYFESKGIDHGLEIDKLKEGKPDPWLAVWANVPEAQKPDMEADFRDIFALSNEGGTLAIMDELQWQLAANDAERQAAAERISALANHFERAMVAFLDYPRCWKGATRFQHADSLSSSWRKRKNLPKKDAAVDPASIKQLSSLISGYFHHTEGRGKHCVVEPYRRGDRDYFFAYPEDHSQRANEWVEGEFQPRPHNPAFEVVFVYSKREGALDIHYKGGKKAVDAMQAIFAQAILKLDELPADPKDERVYDLAPLARPDFEFTFKATSGIEQVVVKKIRLSSVVKNGDRITLEANTNGDRMALHDLLASVQRALPAHHYRVSQVELAARVTVDPDKPPKTVTVRITHPNSCSLKYDELGLKLRDMLDASGIEPKEAAKEPPETAVSEPLAA